MQKSKGNKYFIQQFIQEQYLHGGIGGSDAERVLLANGFEPIIFPDHHEFSVFAKFRRLIFFFRMMTKIKKEDSVVFIFPLYAKLNMILLSRIRKRIGARVICFIADINGLKDRDEILLQKELKYLKQFDQFIVHSAKMEQWVKTNIPGVTKVTAIEFFDFLVQPFSRKHPFSYQIVFAGNLAKSSFLQHLYKLENSNPSLHFHLYGEGQPANLEFQKNVTWHGVEKPYELPVKLYGSFGLVWDGESIDGAGGSLGEYMKYISHHKLSLYIVSGLPLIVPSFAASAELVLKYEIGLTVDSLYEVEKRLTELDKDVYSRMQNNLAVLADRISKGKCLGNALEEILKD